MFLAGWLDFFRRHACYDVHPLYFSLLSQLVGIVAAFGFGAVFAPLFFEHFLAIAVLQGIFAMLVAWRLQAPIWWLMIHLVFMPCLVLASSIALPSWIWLSGFFFLLLIFWRTDISQVPLYLTNGKSRDALLSLLPDEPCRMIDIGCGDGGVLRHLARARPDCTFVGLEHAPLTWAWAWVISRKYSNVSIRRGDFWEHSLTGYDLVYAFLSPAPMIKLRIKAQSEMMPSAYLVSNSFAIPDMPVKKVINVKDQRKTCLYIYQFI